ncbi:hypothetical protein SteCoe_6084 [Stentor coeruleus]|uniref:Uncharacterized protein n=1 Tax=Stentor coeruleus TaxID=5963 RepID=A0A1R2CQX1_9CILI|nr:hypothetical protein SteCoe_6084 [Stentor coeruleus]
MENLENLEGIIDEINSKIEEEFKTAEKYRKEIQELILETKKFEITIDVKDEEFRRMQHINEELKEKIDYFKEKLLGDEDTDKLREDYENSNLKLESESSILISQNKTISSRIKVIQESIENDSFLLDEDNLKSEIDKLSNQLLEMTKDIDNYRDTQEDIDCEIKTFTQNNKLLTENHLEVVDKLANLQTIKENLLEKISSYESNEKELLKKVEAHEAEEKKLAEEVIYYRKQAEEALLSFQKFDVKSVGFLTQEKASIVISKGIKNFIICINIGKQQIILNKENYCVVSMHPKKKHRFYVILENKTREFESYDAEKITHFLNLAIKMILES